MQRLGEFELIREYFSGLTHNAEPATLGVGDDAALLSLQGQELSVSVDTLVEGVHFPAGAAPGDIASRALCVSASDLAAMGATPRWFLLALTMPAADPHWLHAFAQQLSATAASLGMGLIGGDTTRGPLTLSLTVFGVQPYGMALRRSGARIGDRICVSGCLGEGAAALHALMHQPRWPTSVLSRLHERFYAPQPAFAEGNLLRGVASSAIDISDGLCADVAHVAAASGLEAVIELEKVPIATALIPYVAQQQLRAWALFGGDDYRLCFTVAPASIKGLTEAFAERELAFHEIGYMSVGVAGNVSCLDANGHAVAIHEQGYQHFGKN